MAPNGTAMRLAMMKANRASSNVTGKPLENFRSHIDAVLEGSAEIAFHCLAQPFEILDVQRPIEPVQRLKPHDGLWRCINPQSRTRGRTRHHIDRDEQDQRSGQQSWNK